MATADATGPESSGDEPILRAQLSIQPDEETSCPLVDAGDDAREVSQQLKTTAALGEPAEDFRACHTEIAVDSEGGPERAYLRSTVTANCVCPVFAEHECISRITAVRSGSVTAVVTIPRRENLRGIIADLRASGATVSVEWLVESGDAAATMEVEVSAVTDKQQEAMEAARELGYYDAPRRADLGDVARRLGISESATSQRLNAAETKLVRSFLDG